MKLSAYPFHSATGELLPAYRDAYLRGDLSSENTELVDGFLKEHREKGDEVLRRFHEMSQKGHTVRPVGWVQRQFDLIRTEPERFRRRAASLLIGGVVVSGAVFARNNLPNTINTPTENTPVVADAVETAAEAGAAGAVRMVAVKGRILDENGHPLIGATVLQKGTQRGVSTDAEGNYTLRLPANQKSTLQYGYAGYSEEEMLVRSGATANVTLLPKAGKTVARKRWLFF